MSEEEKFKTTKNLIVAGTSVPTLLLWIFGVGIVLKGVMFKGDHKTLTRSVFGIVGGSMFTAMALAGATQVAKSSKVKRNTSIATVLFLIAALLIPLLLLPVSSKIHESLDSTSKKVFAGVIFFLYYFGLISCISLEATYMRDLVKEVKEKEALDLSSRQNAATEKIQKSKVALDEHSQNILPRSDLSKLPPTVLGWKTPDADINIDPAHLALEQISLELVNKGHLLTRAEAQMLLEKAQDNLNIVKVANQEDNKIAAAEKAVEDAKTNLESAKDGDRRAQVFSSTPTSLTPDAWTRGFGGYVIWRGLGAGCSLSKASYPFNLLSEVKVEQKPLPRSTPEASGEFTGVVSASLAMTLPPSVVALLPQLAAARSPLVQMDAEYVATIPISSDSVSPWPVYTPGVSSLGKVTVTCSSSDPVQALRNAVRALFRITLVADYFLSQPKGKTSYLENFNLMRTPPLVAPIDWVKLAREKEELDGFSSFDIILQRVWKFLGFTPSSIPVPACS
jgi:hypothetical protein